MRKILALLIAVFLMSTAGCANAYLFKKKIVKSKTPVFAPVNDVNGNKVWVGTFQLVWNDLMDNIVKAQVEFKNGTPELVKLLNKQGFDNTELSENSYYQAHGTMTPELKNKIETAIDEKFNEKSDILDNLSWNSKDYLIYAMLYKNFEYLAEFDILEPNHFEHKKVKYFGIDKGEKNELYQNVEVLFYSSKNDYAVKLKTKDNEEVILYRTDDTLSLEEYFNKLNKKKESYKGEVKLHHGDLLKVPFINFNRMFEYNELTGKKIKGTNFTITGAIQTAKFKLDNKGGTLKSEGALIMRMSLMPEIKGRHFFFDKPFVLFLKETDKTLPYFIMEVKNAELLEEVY